MAMDYEELDDETREYMLEAFEEEEASGNPYRSAILSDAGLEAWPDLMRDAIQTGNEVTLGRALNDPKFWNPRDSSGKRVNVRQASHRLALTEFSTWYVRGFAKRLMDQGVEKCQVYRGEEPKWEPGACAEHEGMIVDVETVYEGHRARYWPEPGDDDAFSIPFGPGCHHVIRRVE